MILATQAINLVRLTGGILTVQADEPINHVRKTGGILG